MNKKRKPNDFYPTPPNVCRSVIQVAKQVGALKCYNNNLTVLEPSAGDGAFFRGLRNQGFSCYTHMVEPHEKPWIDPNDQRCLVFQTTLEEFNRKVFRSGHGYGLIIGNPPYSLAEEHVRLCLGMLSPGGSLVFLLRLSFLESKKREVFWSENPCSSVHVFSRRPSFTANSKTDCAAYAVFVWNNDEEKKQTTLHHIKDAA